MGVITTKDGVEIFYKDWGKGQPIVFHHGWPLSADDWDAQMMFFLGQATASSRTTAAAMAAPARPRPATTWTPTPPTRRRSTDALDLKDAIHVGHSTGGGEVARYVARHGRGRVAKAVLISAVPPIMVKIGNQSGRPADRGVRRLPRRNSPPTARSSTCDVPRARSTASTGRARRSRKASSTTGGARA